MEISKTRKIAETEEITDKEFSGESVIEGSLVEDLKKQFSLSNLKDFFSSLLKSNRRIDTESYTKEDDSLVYKLNLVFLGDDDDIDISIPAILRLAKTDAENSNIINMYFQLPDKNYSQNHQMVDVDTTEYQGIENSKDLVSKACWKLFDAQDYTKDTEFLSQFTSEGFVESFNLDEEEEDNSEEGTEDLESSENIMNSTKIMRVQLQKVESKTGYDIELKKIRASYDATEALSDLDSLLTAEFIDELNTSEPVTYDIAVTDDDIVYDIIKEEEENYQSEYLRSGYDAILNEAYVLYFNCIQMKHTVCGRDMIEMINRLDSYCWIVRGQIDRIEQIMVESKYEIINPIIRIQGINPDRCYIFQETYFDEFYNLLVENIKSYVSTIDLYSCNMPYAINREIQDWIVNWNHELNYFLERMVK